MIVKLIPSVASPDSYPAHEWVGTGLGKIAELQVLLNKQKEAVRRGDFAEARKLNDELRKTSRS